MECRYDKHKECDEKSFHFCEDCIKDRKRSKKEITEEMNKDWDRLSSKKVIRLSDRDLKKFSLYGKIEIDGVIIEKY